MTARPHFRSYLALSAVCIFWGTTYVAIRVALESFSPITLVAARFLLSGALLMAFAKWKGLVLPRGAELGRAVLFGLMLLGVANGCLTFVETWVPSGVAALMVVTGPFWLVGIEALAPGGDRLSLPVVTGMLIGVAGVAMLVTPGAAGGTDTAALWSGFALLQMSSFVWNLASVLQRRWTMRANAFVTAAVQQLAAGGAYFVLWLVLPQPSAVWSVRGVAGLVWLVVFGSIIGFSAYLYSLETLPVSVVAIYTYVNPIVAVILGRLFYDEPIGYRELTAMAIIFAGVAVVKRFSHRGTLRPALRRG